MNSKIIEFKVRIKVEYNKGTLNESLKLAKSLVSKYQCIYSIHGDARILSSKRIRLRRNRSNITLFSVLKTLESNRELSQEERSFVIDHICF